MRHITHLGGSFPLLRAAVLTHIGCARMQCALDDPPPLVLAEVAAEMRSQVGAYTIFREFARAKKYHTKYT